MTIVNATPRFIPKRDTLQSVRHKTKSIGGQGKLVG
jgi:hypothetical protein